MFVSQSSAALSMFALPQQTYSAWGRVVSDGFGDPGNRLINTFSEFKGQLYAGTSNMCGSQIWRSTDGISWTLAITLSNQAVSLASFDDQLYVALLGCGCPGPVWRSSDGISWTISKPVNGYESFYDLITYSHTLYAVGEDSFNTRHLWRTSDGLDWQPITHSAFMSTWVGMPIVFKDRFYVPVPGNGASLWRTDGLTWEAVITNGFSMTQNSSISLGTFGDQLYAVTRNEATNLQIWRTVNGLDWTQVVSGGLGDPPHNTGNRIQLIEFQGQLFLFSGFLAYEREVWRSPDGVTWEPVRFDDWSTSRPNLHGLTVFNGRLLVSTGILSPTQGFKLWSYLTHPHYLPLLALRN